jgi:hypothetical protein
MTLIEQATVAAEKWLALNDAGWYGTAWDVTADSCKHGTDRMDWVRSIRISRQPLGRLTGRTHCSTYYSDILPDGSIGTYLLLGFSSDFERSPGLIETVTTSCEADGAWKVAGYFSNRRVN